jgi:ADP-ribosylglycohydrolase
LIGGASLLEALQAAMTILRTQADCHETLRALEAARELAADETPHHIAIAQLGEGWIAEEALAVAVYCALVARDFEHGVVLAVNHDGDSDSTGSIAGNLLGAIYGAGAIPAKWLDPLELREVITTVAQDLCAFRDWKIGDLHESGEMDPRMWGKYPGN